MRYRALDDDGDYVFGRGPGEFLVNSPEAVAQAIKTRLGLSAGEWFLDNTEGTPYFGQILGEGTRPLYDQAIRDRILGTPGVLTIDEYDSTLDGNTRKLTVQAKVTTQFGGQRVLLNGSQILKPGQLLDIDFVLDQSTLG